MTRDDDDVVTLYVDGSAVATPQAIPGSVSARAEAGLRFGARLGGLESPFIGALDELYVAGRSLTADEIAAAVTTNRYPGGSALFHLPLDRISKA